METQIGRWGNSLAIRIPQAFARELQLDEGGTVELTVAKGRLVVAPVGQRYELDDLVEQITPENRHVETNWGKAEGAEAW